MEALGIGLVGMIYLVAAGMVADAAERKGHSWWWSLGLALLAGPVLAALVVWFLPRRAASTASTAPHPTVVGTHPVIRQHREIFREIWDLCDASLDDQSLEPSEALERIRRLVA